MKAFEVLRTLLIAAGLIVAAGAYCKIIGKAFKRGTIWGLFTLFCLPFGGWLNCFGEWWDLSRVFIAHAAGLAVAVGAFLFFPRVPVYGYWTDSSDSLVYRFDADGTIRDFGMSRDGKFSFRGTRILTRELSIPSVTRLKITKRGYNVGYYNPKDAELWLYPDSKDPEVFFVAVRGSGLELHRVPDPEAPAFKARIAELSQQKVVFDAGAALLDAIQGGTLAKTPDSPLLQRYERYRALARSAPAAELEKLSVVDQVNILRLRSLYAREIRSGASAAALLTADFTSEYLPLPHSDAEIVNVNRAPDAKKALVSFVASRRDGGLAVTLPANLGSDGRWSFDLSELRDRDIEKNSKRVKTGALAGAWSYLKLKFAIDESPELLRPLVL